MRTGFPWTLDSLVQHVQLFFFCAGWLSATGQLQGDDFTYTHTRETRDTRRFTRVRCEDAAVTAAAVTLRRCEQQPWPKWRTCLSGNAIYTTPTALMLVENFQFLVKSIFFPSGRIFVTNKLSLVCSPTSILKHRNYGNFSLRHCIINSSLEGTSLHY